MTKHLNSGPPRMKSGVIDNFLKNRFLKFLTPVMRTMQVYWCSTAGKRKQSVVCYRSKKRASLQQYKILLLQCRMLFERNSTSLNSLSSENTMMVLIYKNPRGLGNGKKSRKTTSFVGVNEIYQYNVRAQSTREVHELPIFQATIRRVLRKRVQIETAVRSSSS